MGDKRCLEEVLLNINKICLHKNNVWSRSHGVNGVGVGGVGVGVSKVSLESESLIESISDVVNYNEISYCKRCPDPLRPTFAAKYVQVGCKLIL